MNEVRIKELESLKLEASKTIDYLEGYVSSRQICNVGYEIKQIKRNKQVVQNLSDLINKLK